MKHCYIRLNESRSFYQDNRYLEVMLTVADDGVPICHLFGNDDWFLSYMGQDAESKFNALLDVSGEVPFDYITQLGFAQLW